MSMHRSFRRSAPWVAALLTLVPLAAAPISAPAANNAQGEALPKMAPCAACAVREGKGSEKVAATAVDECKTYFFRSTNCRDEFLQNPRQFVESSSPRPAPGFTLKDLDGQPVSLGDFKGKVLLLDFWATWCAPCIASMPHLQKLHHRYADKGFAVLGIAVDERGAATVLPLVKKKVTYPILLGDEPTWAAYGVQALPALFLIDREGRIVRQFGGATDERTIEAEVQRLVTGAAESMAPAMASATAPERAVCAVCGVREKSGPEPVVATAVYQGKSYSFCKPTCKEEFLRDPEKWIKAAAALPAAARVAQAPRPGATAVPT